MDLFCPRSGCPNHYPDHSRQWFDYHGCYRSVGRKRQRYRCRACGRTFSRRSLSIDYWTHFPVDYEELLESFVAGSSVRALSRRFGVTTKTILNRISRLARSALEQMGFAQQQMVLTEDLVADGLQNFCVSQDFPCDIHLLAGKESQFLYGFNYALFRRTGKRTPAQESRCKRLYPMVDFTRFPIKRSFAELLIQLLRVGGETERFSTFTDEKEQYRLAILENPELERRRLEERHEHVRINSRAPRTVHNPLFSVNYLDREARKDIPEFHRETVCFGRNVVNMLERVALYFFHHNFCKCYRIGVTGENRTHAEVAGMTKEEVGGIVETAFRRRGFLHDGAIPYGSFFEALWRREVPTPLKKREEYVPQYTVA